MPVKVSKRNGKFRLVESNGRIAKNKSGTALDGGGHPSEAAAKRQQRAVNANVK
jgi:hypothetical protein